MTLLTTALLDGLKSSDTPNEMIEGLKNHLTRISESMARFRHEVGILKKSTDFTKEGRQKRIVDAAQATADELRGIENGAHGYDDHINQLQGSMKPDQRPDDTTLSFLQEQEVRRAIDGMDQLQLKVKYEDLAGNGGQNADLFCAAVENAPMPLLDEETLMNGRMLRGRRKSPEKARLLADLIRVRAALKDALQEAMGELEKAGLPADDFLMRIAKGELVPG